jgi:hypothetical protein
MPVIAKLPENYRRTSAKVGSIADFEDITGLDGNFSVMNYYRFGRRK